MKKEGPSVQDARRCRVVVSSAGESMDSEVTSLRQSTHFIIFEGSPEKFRVIENVAMGQGSESGIEAANFLRSMDINIVITGTIGPRGFQAFEKEGIMVHAGCSGKVRDSVRKCLNGELPNCKGATYAGKIDF